MGGCGAVDLRGRAMRKLRWVPAVLAGMAMLPGCPVLVAAGMEPAAEAQVQNEQRLILKDGSYQAITKYEKKGDRVRYFSSDRDEWEEIPAALIDWTATAKWNKDHGSGGVDAGVPVPLNSAQQPSAGQNGSAGAAAGQGSSGPGGSAANPGDTGLAEAARLDAEAAAIRADERARTPQVAAGLHLPDQDGVFVLDNFQNIPELVHLDQSQGNVNRDPNHNVLRAAIATFHGAEQPVRINGQAARVRLHVNDPVLYVSLDTQGQAMEPESALMVDTHGASSRDDKNQYSSPDSRYAVVKVDVQPHERVIGAMRISRVGAARQDEDIIPAAAEILPGKHWMKLTLKEPLEVGEYALMEILGPGEINLDVWDFGVSPNSPENRHVITPVRSSD